MIQLNCLIVLKRLKKSYKVYSIAFKSKDDRLKIKKEVSSASNTV